ncbi:MAG: calcium/sodium antiporter [Gammaproteobacteria bacterium]|nr:calcium/sodium antiporter [Gammaproteobacteria bacterium]
MWLSWLAIVGGLVLLVWSADRFVIGASAIANNLGVSAIIIGMVIMGFGTSAPEIFVAGTASFSGSPGVAVGNAIGSNIANIALVLGLSALVSPLVVGSQTLKREYPVLFLVSFGVLGLMLDYELSRWDGLFLLFGTVCVVTWMWWLASRERNHGDPLEKEFEAEVPHNMATNRAIFWTLIGLVALVFSSYLLVWGAVNIATAFGISELIIGLTIVAIGTSLPEIAVSVTGSLKGEDDIAIGNIIGSNLFNLLAVLGVGSSISAAPLTPEILTRDYATMLILTVAMFIMAYGFRGKGQINRIEGFLLLMLYGGYMAWLYFTEISPTAGSA